MEAVKRSILFALALSLGCATDPDVFHVGCTRFDELKVSAGLQPTISWSPGCEVGGVAVSEAGQALPGEPGPNGTPRDRMWSVSSVSNAEGPNNLLTSGIYFGVVPKYGQETFAVRPLVAGTEYIVRLYVHGMDHGVHFRQLDFRPE
jgi:hypothetical protein